MGGAAVPRSIGENVWIRKSCRAPSGNIAKRRNLQWLVVVLAPFEIVYCSGRAGVVAVRIGRARQFRARVIRLWLVSIRVPIQALTSPVIDSVDRLARSRGGREKQRTCEVRISGIRRAENQVSVTRQDAHVIAVLVKRMLPAPLTENPEQYQLARMHVRVSVVWLVRILWSVVRVHVIGHGTA